MEASAGQILSICFSVIDQSISFDVLKLSHFVLLLYLHVFTLVTILAMEFIFPFFFSLRFVTGSDARTKTSLVSRIAEVLDVLATYRGRLRLPLKRLLKQDIRFIDCFI